MSTALKYMIVANIIAPILALIFFETANLNDPIQLRFAILFLIALLITNIYHARSFRSYRAANMILFVLNGLSLFLLGEISFITGLYIFALLMFGIMY